LFTKGFNTSKVENSPLSKGILSLAPLPFSREGFSSFQTKRMFSGTPRAGIESQEVPKGSQEPDLTATNHPDERIQIEREKWIKDLPKVFLKAMELVPASNEEDKETIKELLDQINRTGEFYFSLFLYHDYSSICFSSDKLSNADLLRIYDLIDDRLSTLVKEVGFLKAFKGILRFIPRQLLELDLQTIDERITSLSSIETKTIEEGFFLSLSLTDTLSAFLNQKQLLTFILNRGEDQRPPND